MPPSSCSSSMTVSDSMNVSIPLIIFRWLFEGNFSLNSFLIDSFHDRDSEQEQNEASGIIVFCTPFNVVFFCADTIQSITRLESEENPNLIAITSFQTIIMSFFEKDCFCRQILFLSSFQFHVVSVFYPLLLLVIIIIKKLMFFFLTFICSCCKIVIKLISVLMELLVASLLLLSHDFCHLTVNLQ